MLAAASSEFKEKLEAASELRERIGAATEEQKARIEELKKKYTELAGRSTKVFRPSDEGVPKDGIQKPQGTAGCDETSTGKETGNNPVSFFVLTNDANMYMIIALV